MRKADEATAWARLRPDVEFIDLSIQKIYELFPLPHGTQRQAITQILQDWSWKATALQPAKGNIHHMAWRVGAVEPLAAVMTAFGSDVIVSTVKEHKPTIYASAKTQKQLQDPPASSSKPTTTIDPWLEADPWAGYSTKSSSTPSTSTSRKDEIQEQISSEVANAFHDAILKKKDVWMDDGDDTYTTENELRLVALESGVSELKQQNTPFMQWFQQTGDRLQKHEGIMQEVQDTVQTHAGARQNMNNIVKNTEKAIGEVHQTLNFTNRSCTPLAPISKPA